METNDRVLQKIYVTWYSFCILGKNFARLFEVKQLLFPWSCFYEEKNHLFWFQTMKNHCVWRKFFEKYITILSASVNITGVLFVQLVSLLEKLDSKFEKFFTE